jgi:transcriptional regulator
MYQPPAFRENRPEVMHGLIRTHPLGLLICAVGGLQANLVPFLLDAEAGPHGTLRTHVARANPQWRALAGAEECLAVFQGPQAYVTPGWYETKRQTGRVVPTWNFAVVQCRGRPRVIEDADWLRAQATALTETHEAQRAQPWAVSDAPEEFVAAQLRGIVGVEIPILRMEGKWKASQNRPEADRAGVAEGLAETEPDMAALVRQGGASIL